MDKYYIPQLLDEPMRFLLWTMDELVAFIFPFAVLIALYNQVIVGGFIGAVLVYGLKKLKGEQGHFFIFNLMYWHLPAIIKFKTTPPSCYREFIG